MRENTGVRFETVFLTTNPPDDERTEQLIYWCHRFDKLGLTPKSAGNLSFRTNKGFVITGTGFNLAAIDKEKLVEVSKIEIAENQILLYAGGRVIPSKESLFHSEIYRLRAEINAVFHVHDQLVLTVADQIRIPFTEQEQPRGSYELVEEVTKLLGITEGIRYFALKNHGVIAMGETLEEAGRLVEDVNGVARNQTSRVEVENEGDAGI